MSIRKKLGAQNVSAIPSGQLVREEIRLVDPKNLYPSPENERITLKLREVRTILGIGTDDDKRIFEDGVLILPADIHSLDVPEELLAINNIKKKWASLMELASSMYADEQAGRYPGGILHVMRDENGDKLFITVGHRRQLAAVIAGVKVWVKIHDFIPSKFSRAQFRAHENLKREDLTLEEHLLLYNNILEGLEEEGVTANQTEAAKALGKTKGWVSIIHKGATNPLLHSAINDGIISSYSVLRDICGLPDTLIANKISELRGEDAAQEKAKPKAKATVSPSKAKGFKLKGTIKDMGFASTLLKAALDYPLVSEQKDKLLKSARLEDLSQDEMSALLNDIIKLINHSAKNK